jgi:hypothetical protein
MCPATDIGVTIAGKPLFTSGFAFHSRHHVLRPPAILLELSHSYVAIEQSHGQAEGKTMIGSPLCLWPKFRRIRDALDYSGVGLNRDRPDNRAVVSCSSLGRYR